MALLDRIREAAAGVAARAGSVEIDRDALRAYAADLPVLETREPDAIAASDALVAEVLCLDAVNFGSGWFPTLRKAPGVSGYATVASALRVRFERDGPWAPAELAEISAAEVAQLLGQDPGHELMDLYAYALRELAARILDDFGSDWSGPVGAAGGSAEVLVDTIAGWDGWRDISVYDGLEVPFFKRAQIAAADLARAGAAEFSDLARLTMFADNLVPHVLRLDGVLAFAPELTARIAEGELLEHGAPAEVEIRACALHAVELMVAERPDLAAYQVDELLWNRGGEPRYKAVPRHRARCKAY